MAIWTTRSLSQQARGTTAVTFTFTAATAGSRLLEVVCGPVTFTTPAGWTAVNSAVNIGGLYVFTKVAAGGETSTAHTINATNEPTVAVVYEFPSGSTVGPSATKTSSGTTSISGAALSGLTGTNLLFSFVGAADSSSGGTTGFSAWSSSAVEDTDVAADWSSNDGYRFGAAYLEDSVLTSWTPTATQAAGSATAESLTVAVNVAGGAVAPALPIIVLAPRR